MFNYVYYSVKHCACYAIWAVKITRKSAPCPDLQFKIPDYE